MDTADHWHRRIHEIEREKIVAGQRGDFCAAVIAARLAERKTEMASVLRLFEASESAAFMRVELGKQKIDGALIQRSYNSARQQKLWYDVRFPRNVLLTHRPTSRFVAFTYLGLTEFEHCYRLWNGNGLRPVRVTPETFAATYVDYHFANGVRFDVSDEETAAALDPRWSHLSDADWKQRAKTILDTPLDPVAHISGAFDTYLRVR